MEENQLELENRIRNLVWTISEDYDTKCKINIELFLQAKEAALYEGIKQGAMAKYFDTDAVSLYLIKKIYLQAIEAPLMAIAQLCMESAVYRKLTEARRGVASIRKKAYEQILDLEFEQLSKSPLGNLKIAVLQRGIRENFATTKLNRKYLEKLDSLENTEDTMKIIEVIDELYNEIVDSNFEKRVGNLEEVLKISLEELTEHNWKDYLTEEMYEEAMEKYLTEIKENLANFETPDKPPRKEEEEEKPSDAPRMILVDEKELQKVYSYVELNFGKTYLSEMEEKRRNFNLCKGLHGDCGLYYTEGILKNSVKRNYQYEYARKQKEKNKFVYYDQHRMVKYHIKKLTELFSRSLTLRMEEQDILSDRGVLKPALLWKVGRTNDVRFFQKRLKNENMELVIDILIDASGSQRVRQPQVAMQAYIISEALSNVGISHRVSSFCTFWDYTILQRFRDYDDDRSQNENIFEYTTSSNNRDGLAIQAVSSELMLREEENKILIVLSDGRPYDVILNRPNARNPKPYQGEYAIKDTAFAVRSLRNNGIAVLGVFAGEEKDLEAEKKIFGKDFAYIHDIRYFSEIVGSYLQKQLEE